MEITIQKVNEEQIESVDLSLKRAPLHLLAASVSLRSCFLQSCADVPEFVELRDRVHKGAIVFKEGLLPMSETVVSGMKDFFDYYVALSLEDWKLNLDDIVVNAEGYQLKCSTLSAAYTALLTDLKKLEGPAEEVQRKLGLDAKEFEAKALEAERLAETAANRSSLLSVFGDVLACIPLPPTMLLSPLANFIASKFQDEADAQHATGVANHAQKEVAYAATKCISELLIPAIGQFISAMTDIAGFFHVLASEVKSFHEKGATAQGDPKKIHFMMMNHKAKGLIEKCSTFIAVHPALVSDMDAIPAGRSANWVKEWLKEKREGKSMYDRFTNVRPILPQSITDAMDELRDSEG